MIVPVAGVPPITVCGLTVNEERVGGGGGVPSGSTVMVAETVTPPPLTKTFTTVGTVTAVGSRVIPPVRLPDAISVPVDRNGNTAGLSLLTCRVWSVADVFATVTMPAPCAPATVMVGCWKVSDIGFTWGTTVIDALTLVPCQVAVMVTGVGVVTGVVWIGMVALALLLSSVMVAGPRRPVNCSTR